MTAAKNFLTSCAYDKYSATICGSQTDYSMQVGRCRVVLPQICFSGEVGITTNCDWFDPQDPVKQSDLDAADRGIQFFMGWFAHPIFVDGDYPQVMKTFVRSASLAEGRQVSRLPEFTQQEMMRIKGKVKFVI